ncbi:hypothetical protein D6861_010695 [Macrococcoides caseolyticum]|nr:hypothetical protein [Macrococcus caseolyticus]RKO12961.1 hypothetical protein D6861_10800 [Macrococcus caseolyticus]
MDPTKLLQIDSLGKKMMAVKSYEETVDFESKKHNGYRINISLQDENSPAFMEMITVKIKTTNPSITEKEMASNKIRSVTFKNLNIGIWNNQLTFSADDILPVN